MLGNEMSNKLNHWVQFYQSLQIIFFELRRFYDRFKGMKNGMDPSFFLTLKERGKMYPSVETVFLENKI